MSDLSFTLLVIGTVVLGVVSMLGAFLAMA